MENIKAAIFDLDGTLVDSMWVWDRLMRDFLFKYNLVASEEMYRRVAFMTLVQSSEYFCREFETLDRTPGQVRAEWKEMVYHSYAEKVMLKPGVKEFLQRLKQNGVKTAIATACAVELAEACLKHNGIFEMFDEIVYADEVGGSKETPKIFEECLRRLGCSADEAVLFEDILVALNSAKQINLHTVIIEDDAAKADRDELKRLADRYILDFTEIL